MSLFVFGIMHMTVFVLRSESQVHMKNAVDLQKKTSKKLMRLLSKASPNKVDQWEEEDQWMLDDGAEWEVWDIVTIKESKIGENSRRRRN